MGAHAYVWVDDAIDAPDNLTQTDWNTTAATFDADFARETAAFAPAFSAGLAPYNETTSGGNTYTQCDANGGALAQMFPPYQATPDLSGADPHISILVTNALENTGEGGYFDFTNLLSDQELNCPSHPHVPSNNLRMFVIGTDKYGSGNTPDETYWRTQDMPRSVPHEFQHYLHTLNKVLVADPRTRTARAACSTTGSWTRATDARGGPRPRGGVNPPQSPDSRVLAFEYLYTPGNSRSPRSPATTPTRWTRRRCRRSGSSARPRATTAATISRATRTTASAAMRR